MSYWLQKIREGADPDSQIIMLGNKIDLINDIEVDQDVATKLAQDNNIQYFQTSAKDGKNLDMAFSHLLSAMLQNEGLQNKLKRHKETFKITPNGTNKRKRKANSKCCK